MYNIDMLSRRVHYFSFDRSSRATAERTWAVFVQPRAGDLDGMTLGAGDQSGRARAQGPEYRFAG
jgi:hypothetical protein